MRGQEIVKRRYQTIDELLSVDESTPLEPGDFDDALWTLLCARVFEPEDLESLPEAVSTYYASRLLEWEVGNGGFAQAAYNIPAWFPRAEAGYRALGKEASARLIQKAIQLLPSERQVVERKGLLRAKIGDVFAHFRESRMAALDVQIPDAEWWIDDERVAFVRSHRETFRGIV